MLIFRAMQMIILHSYVIADDINGVMASLEKDSKALFEWFENNLLKSNVDKCHFKFKRHRKCKSI